MPMTAGISFAAAYFGLIIAAVVVYRDWNSLVHRLFATGIVLFAIEEVFRGLSFRAVLLADVLYWQKFAVLAASLTPGVWFAFSSIYARANAQELWSKRK